MDTQLNQSYDFIVIGGGVYGICTAYYLSKYTNFKTLLIQQFQIGHQNGSSHSTTRITRSTYKKEVYRDLNLKALSQNWKQMEQVLNFKLVYPTPFIYYDNVQASYTQFKKNAEGKDNFKFMTPVQVCQNYKGMPLIKSKYNPILDIKAGILAAQDFILKLKQFLLTKCKNNLTVLQNTKVTKVQQTGGRVRVTTQNKGIFQCRRVVVTSGKWVSQLVPDMKDLTTVVKQYVSYLQLHNMPQYDITKFYSFYFTQRQDLKFFSMADHKEVGLKLGRDKFTGWASEEDNFQYQYKFFAEKAQQIFGQAFIKVRKVQACYYTITPSHDFILDFTNQRQNIFVCSSCSGHGFKFSPIIGDIIAQIITSKDLNQSAQYNNNSQNLTKNQVYNKWNHIFKLAYHRGMNLV